MSPGMNLRWLPVAMLVLVAVASSWLLWQLYQREEPASLVGPPRSDYSLTNFDLIALDDEGRESFRVTGPMLSRHPFLGTLDIEQPTFRFPDSDGKPWNANADRAWAAADGKELRLVGDVEFDGPPREGGGRIELRTPRLNIFPDAREVKSDALVNIVSPGATLRGRGLYANLDTRRFQLLSEVRADYAPSSRR